MMKRLQVKFNERVVLFKANTPVRALVPGRYLLWGRMFSEQRWDTDVWFNAGPGVRELLPTTWYAESRIGDEERGVLYKDGKHQRSACGGGRGRLQVALARKPARQQIAIVSARARSAFGLTAPRPPAAQLSAGARGPHWARGGCAVD